MITVYEKQEGVPKFECLEFEKRQKEYTVLIPIINEGERIIKELERAYKHNVADYADIVICDGRSTDGCTAGSRLRKLRVNTLLVKTDIGRQGSRLVKGEGC